MDISKELIELAARINNEADARLVREAACRLMSASEKLEARVAAYVEEVALVADVVAGLGLRHNQGVVVGKALSRLGFERTLTRYDSKVYPLWVRNAVFPKFELAKILRRCKSRAQEGGGGRVRDGNLV